MSWKPGKQGFKKKGETACSKRVKENEKKIFGFGSKEVRKKARLQASRKWMQEVLRIYLAPGAGRGREARQGI